MMSTILLFLLLLLSLSNAQNENTNSGEQEEHEVQEEQEGMMSWDDIKDVSTDCDKGWFGSRCQFKCHCTKVEHCDRDTGSCRGGCEDGYIGPLCQYKTFPLVQLPDQPKLPSWMLGKSTGAPCSGGREECTFLKVGLSMPSRLTWIRIGIKDRLSVKIHLYDRNYTRFCPYSQKVFEGKNFFDIPCWTNHMVHAISFTGEGVRDMWMVAVSPGRDILLKWLKADKTIVHETNGDPMKKVSDNFCQLKEITESIDGPSTTFLWPDGRAFVNLVHLRRNSKVSDDYHVFLFSEAKTMFRSHNRTPFVNNSKYFVFEKGGLVVELLAYAGDIDDMKGDIYAVCELEAFGDVFCEDSKWGVQCEHDCNCADSFERCHPATGDCTECVTGKECSLAMCSEHCKFGVEGCDKATKVCKEGCKDHYGGPDCNRYCGDDECPEICSWACESKCYENTTECIDRCRPGFKRPFCTEVCDQGTFDSDCDETCKGKCLHNKCNPATGQCYHGCSLGLKPPKCTEVCDDSRYGRECSESCKYRCKDQLCDNETGRCKSCPPGMTGDNCDQACPVGTFGENCGEKCPFDCFMSKCHVLTGECLSCPDGRRGKLCEKECAVGYYGHNCSKTCSENCKGADNDCHYITGTCSLGCKGNFKLPLCEGCMERWYGSNCSQSCPECGEDGCDGLGRCLGGCRSGLTGENCDQVVVAASTAVDDSMDTIDTTHIAILAIALAALVLAPLGIFFARRSRGTGAGDAAAAEEKVAEAEGEAVDLEALSASDAKDEDDEEDEIDESAVSYTATSSSAE